jgi:hypothetical protein
MNTLAQACCSLLRKEVPHSYSTRRSIHTLLGALHKLPHQIAAQDRLSPARACLSITCSRHVCVRFAHTELYDRKFEDLVRVGEHELAATYARNSLGLATLQSFHSAEEAEPYVMVLAKVRAIA